MLIERRMSNARGFTLIELLLALAVLSVLASVVVPAFFQSYFQHRALDQAVASVMETILLTKRQAIQSATPYVYEYVGDANTQCVYPVGQSQPKQMIPLPDNVRLQCALGNTTSDVRLVFREDGSTEGLALVVVAPHADQPIEVTRRLGIPQRVVKK